MLGVITAVLAGSSAVLAGSSAALGAAAASAALVAALASGVIVGLAVLAALVRYQFSASDRAKEAAPFEENQDC